MVDTRDAVYARREDVILREVAGEKILVPIRNYVADMRAVFALTGIGATVWELLDGVRTLDEVLCAIAEQYEVEMAQAWDDLQAFVEQLREADLVEDRG